MAYSYFWQATESEILLTSYIILQTSFYLFLDFYICFSPWACREFTKHHLSRDYLVLTSPSALLTRVSQNSAVFVTGCLQWFNKPRIRVEDANTTVHVLSPWRSWTDIELSNFRRSPKRGNLIWHSSHVTTGGPNARWQEIIAIDQNSA